MSFYRLLLRSLRRHPQTLASPQTPSPSSAALLVPRRTFAFSSAEEAAAERRRRKRRLRIEPPLHALRRDPSPASRRDPNAPRLPDSTSALVGPRLNLHNRVQSLIRASDLDSASAVARAAVFSNTRPTVFTCNAIIAAMYRAGRYSDAVALFTFFFKQSNIVPNVVSYNNLINSHCDEGRVDEGLAVYRHIMENAPFSPSPVTYRHLTKGLIDAGRIGEAMDLLREMLNKGHGADSLVYNNLIAGFLKLGNLEKANELFDELKERCLVYDGVVNATFMEWFFEQGKDKEAMESYRSLLDRQFKMIPATCNVLIGVLLRYGKKAEAWAMFDQMLDNHTPPNFQAVNSETFNIMVNECFQLLKAEEAILAFRKVGTKANSRPFSMDVAGYNNIITRYCEKGMLPEAEAMFAELCSKSLSPDVNCHRTLIDAYLEVNRIDDAVATLRRMVEAGLWVVASYGLKVFDIFIKSGKTVDCVPILKKLGEKDPKPDVSMYEIVLMGLCDEGSLDPSLELVGEMMRHNIGVSPDLQQKLKEAFAAAGRAEELDNVLRRSNYGHAPPSHAARPRPQPSGHGYQTANASLGSPQRLTSEHGYQATNLSSVSPQRQPSGHDYQTANPPQGSPQRTGFHGPPSPQTAGAHQAWLAQPQNSYSPPPSPAQPYGPQYNTGRSYYPPPENSHQVQQPWNRPPETRHQMTGPGNFPAPPPHIGGPHQVSGQYEPVHTYRPHSGTPETAGSYQPRAESGQNSGGNEYSQNRVADGEWQRRY